MKKPDFVLGGAPEVEARLRKVVSQGIRLRKERQPNYPKAWMTALGSRHTDLGIPEASLWLLLFHHFEKTPLKSLPIVMEWARWGAKRLRDWKLVRG